jgi:hypothetical protein
MFPIWSIPRKNDSKIKFYTNRSNKYQNTHTAVYKNLIKSLSFGKGKCGTRASGPPTIGEVKPPKKLEKKEPLLVSSPLRQSSDILGSSSFQNSCLLLPLCVLSCFCFWVLLLSHHVMIDLCRECTIKKSQSWNLARDLYTLGLKCN